MTLDPSRATPKAVNITTPPKCPKKPRASNLFSSEKKAASPSIGYEPCTLVLLLILLAILVSSTIFEMLKYRTLASVTPLYFDGEDDYIHAPLPYQLAGMKPFTVEIWLRISEKPKTTRQNIITIGSPGVGTAIHLLLLPDLRLQYNPWGVWPEAFSKTSLSAGEWHHIVVIYDEDGRATLYINGRVDSQYVYACGWNLHGNISIAKLLVSYVDWFKGSIATVCIWDRALTEKEILKVFNNELPTEDLILSFRGRVENDTLIDESGSNHGKIYGATPSSEFLRSLFSKPELLVIDFHTVKLVMDPYLIISIYMIILLMMFFTKYNTVGIYIEKKPFKIKILFFRESLEALIEKIFAINIFTLMVLLFIYVFLPSIHNFSSIMLQGTILITFICLGVLRILTKEKDRK